MRSGKPDSECIAAIFKALGDPTRLRIFHFLRCCTGPVSVDDRGDVRPTEGPTAGEVCCHVTGVEKVNSTLSFHLKELRLAGLITMQRRGKHMVCSANPDAMRLLAAFFEPCARTATTCEETDRCPTPS
jgi:DNA-binding transcriptional ArsR family regulator